MKVFIELLLESCYWLPADNVFRQTVPVFYDTGIKEVFSSSASDMLGEDSPVMTSSITVGSTCSEFKEFFSVYIFNAMHHLKSFYKVTSHSTLF